MTATDYLATETYRLREQEMIRDNERRRIALERLENSPASERSTRGNPTWTRVRIQRLQSLLRRQPARG